MKKVIVLFQTNRKKSERSHHLRLKIAQLNSNTALLSFSLLLSFLMQNMPHGEPLFNNFTESH